MTMPRKPFFMKLPQSKVDELTDFINKNDSAAGGDIRVSIRGRVILASIRGMSVKQIIAKFGFKERTIWYWRRAYEKYGIEGLKAKPRSK